MPKVSVKELSDKQEAMLVNEGIKQADNGEVVSANEVFATVKARYTKKYIKFAKRQ